MADRVRKWLSEGKDVRIMTARVDGGTVALNMGNEAGEHFKNIERVKSIIQDWTEKHFGVRLPVTNVKDYGMIELWDDRAIQVIPNTGETLQSQLTAKDKIIEVAKDSIKNSTLLLREANMYRIAKKLESSIDGQLNRNDEILAEIAKMKEGE